jgi:hypothetical protein
MRVRRPRDHDDTTNNSATRRSYMPISVAFVDTAHFSFHGLGDTPQQAVDAVMRAWAQHVRLTGAHPDHVTRDEHNGSETTPTPGGMAPRATADQCLGPGTPHRTCRHQTIPTDVLPGAA